MMTTHYLRLGEAVLVRLGDVVRIDPSPACNTDTGAGLCVLDENHRGTHLPLPDDYEPSEVPA